jgi:5-methyltetrahydrofolate--homocysteine methyltransferase
MDVLSEIQRRLYEGDQDALVALVHQALDEQVGPEVILQGGLIAGMDRVGKDFREGTLFVPEVIFSAKAMQAGMSVLKPVLGNHAVKSLGRIVIGTVKGDLHDIGKSLVAIMLEGSGFQVVDLGVDVPATKFMEAVETYQPNLVGMSSLLTTTMDEMRVVIQALEQAGLRDKVKVMVGGAPITAGYAKKIGADGYAANAGGAVTTSKQLLCLPLT